MNAVNVQQLCIDTEITNLSLKLLQEEKSVEKGCTKGRWVNFINAKSVMQTYKI